VLTNLYRQKIAFKGNSLTTFNLIKDHIFSVSPTNIEHQRFSLLRSLIGLFDLNKIPKHFSSSLAFLFAPGRFAAFLYSGDGL
jgi:hypothetical protein